MENYNENVQEFSYFGDAICERRRHEQEMCCQLICKSGEKDRYECDVECDFCISLRKFKIQHEIDIGTETICPQHRQHRRRQPTTAAADVVKSVHDNIIDIPISIEKRNARERCRVRAVNEAFVRLRRAIPSIAARTKRVSKVKTLQKALQYIMELEFLLNSYRC